jgi:hypothetical protein
MSIASIQQQHASVSFSDALLTNATSCSLVTQHLLEDLTAVRQQMLAETYIYERESDITQSFAYSDTDMQARRGGFGIVRLIRHGIPKYFDRHPKSPRSTWELCHPQTSTTSTSRRLPSQPCLPYSLMNRLTRRDDVRTDAEVWRERQRILET